MRESLYYQTSGSSVTCNLCRFHCIIPEGSRGICNVRKNQEGILYSLTYGKAVAVAVDPIEKKPLYHFHPGSKTFSVAAAGCNFSCRQCQNWSIAQYQGSANIPGENLPPMEIVSHALAEQCSSVAFTYTEPTVFYEYCIETAKLSQMNGLKNVFVTNGYICAEPLQEIAPCLDAANIDLKGFDEKNYREVFGGKLSEVLDSIIEFKRLGIWIELTTLVIPGVNDSEKELRQIAGFIQEELGCNTPWHISRFHPTFRMTDRAPTPVNDMVKAAEIGRNAGLNNIYLGNVSISGGKNTFCHNCNKILVERKDFNVTANHLKDGCCPCCGTAAAGIWG